VRRRLVKELDGLAAIRELKLVEPGMGIVAHGDLAERRFAKEALQAGAGAFITRSAGPEEMSRAIAFAMDGGGFIDPRVPAKGARGVLTRRQRQILQRLADGESTSNAASRLGLSEETVKTHTKNIISRLQAHNRAHAVAIALRTSLID